MDYFTQINQRPDFEALRESNRKRLINHFMNSKFNETVLDVGCGTGLFSSLAMAMGLKVHAFDISPGLLQRAQMRLSHVEIQSVLKQLKTLGVSPIQNPVIPKLWKGDAVKAINYISGPYHTILCLGGTLELMSDPERALILMIEALHARGTIFLEIESKCKAIYWRELIKDLIQGRLRLIQFIRVLKSMLGHEPLKMTRLLKGTSGNSIRVPFHILSLDAIKEIAFRHDCQINVVLGHDWLRSIIPFSSKWRDVIEKALSRTPFLSRFASVLWIEIARSQE